MTLLSKFAKVNLIQEFSKTIKTFWIFLAIPLANELIIYFGFNDINAALDMKLNFEWITTERRLSFIYNSTDLPDYEKAHLLSRGTFT